MSQVKKEDRKRLALLLAVLQVMLVFAVVPVSAADDTTTSGTCGIDGNGDNLTWTLDSTGTLTISGTGEMAYYQQDSSSGEIAPWRQYTVKNVVITEGVTTIGQYAFYGCDALESVSLPESMLSFNNFAFQNCTSLESITIPDKVWSIGQAAFSDCTALTSVTISNASKLQSIADSTFEDCTSLTSVTIPSSATSIGERAFYGCKALTGITIPASVTSIGSYAFYGCSSLESVTIPGTKTIGESAFWGCTSLTSVTLSEGVTTIGESAFLSCNKLTSVTIPKSVKSIGKNAFSYCTGLTSLTISEGVETIDESAFSNCTGLTNVTIPDSVSSLAYFAFGGCTQLKEVTLPANIETIAGSTFEKCSGLESVTIPEKVKSIGTYAFYECTGLTSVTLSEGVTTIGESAFEECTSLPSITIPKSVKSIEKFAFWHCSSLKKVTYNGTETEWKNISGYDSAFANLNVEMVYEGDTAPIASGSCGDSLTWKLDSEGTLTISGTGAMTDYASLTVPWSNYTINKVVIDNGVTTIGHYAFKDCSSLKSVTISDSVTYIGGCAFQNCSSLERVTIPASVTSIDINAFDGCSSLQNVTYTGTKEQWNAITIASGNDDLKNATISYTGGVIDATLYTLSGTIEDFGYFADRSNVHSSTYEESAKEGDNVWYCVYADDGYVLQQLEVGSELKSIGQTFYSGYYVMGAENATITAKFRPESDDGFKIDYNSDLKNGTISVDGTLVEAGETVTVTVKPNPGYKLASLTGNYQVKGGIENVVLSEVGNGVYTFTMPPRNVHLNVEFKIAQDYGFQISEGNAYISSDVEDIPPTELADAEVTGIGGAVDANDILKKSGLEETPEMVLLAEITVTAADLEAQTISFEVTPVAIILDSNWNPVSVEITNDKLNGNPITVKLPIPTEMKDPEEIVHISDDGTKEYYTLDGAKKFTIEELPSGQHVAVLQVTHFSTFVMNGAHEHDMELTGAKDATCTKDGYTGDEVCKTCGETITKGKTIPKLGHKTEVKNAKDATCTENGYTGDKVCKTCGVTIEKGQTIPKLGHKTEVKNAKDATCTEDGYTGDKVCKTCGKTVETGKAIPAKGHTWDNGKVTQKPTLTKEGVKTYTCTVCDKTKTERIEKLTTCDAGEDCPTHNYKDVKFYQWYHLDVDYVVESGLMVGDGGGIFRPDNKLSRAEMVQILYNWAGKPEVTGSSKFSDVADGAWYAKPVIWATENGIVNGVGNGKFAPNDPVTREQLVAMLYRYAEKPEVSNALTDFADANKISDYAVDAVKWAVEQDILRGDGSPRKLRPTDHAKRCEVAAMLHRYIG